MRKLLTIVLLLFTTMVKAQTDYYSLDPRTGASTRIGYSQPSQPVISTPSYVPQYDLSLYKEVLNQKQSAYDRNTDNLIEDLNDLSKIIRLVKDQDTKAYYFNLQNGIINDMNSGKYDLANTTTYNSFRAYILKVKNAVYEYVDSR